MGFWIRPTNVESLKIYSTTLDTYGIIVAVFLIIDKANWVRFFKEGFLVANISPKIVFGIIFFILSKADIDILNWEIWWKTYTI